MLRLPCNHPSSQRRYQQQLRRGLVGLITAGFLGGALPLTMLNMGHATRTQAASLPQDAVSLNWADLLFNTIRYIQIANISDEQEVEIGQQINQMILTRDYRLYQNPQVNEYVDQIGQRLVAASDRRDIPYTFQVVASDEVNAFTIPGGYIYITTGLIQAADNEAQLASVIAHEIAHVNQRHNVQALRQAVLAQGIADTVGLEASTLAQIGYQVAVSLPQNRDYEYEADRLGLEILQQAGYAPIAYVQFLDKLQSRGFTPEFLRTHPTSANRIEALRTAVTPYGNQGRGLSQAAYQRQVEPLL